jgi:hypothetical protein
MSEQESKNLGHKPDIIKGKKVYRKILVDEIIELEIATKKIIWKWSTLNHLVQNISPDYKGYGRAEDFPGKLDINYVDRKDKFRNKDEVFHSNWIDYNEKYNLILVSSRLFSEVWLLDHSTTTEEAARSKGGVYKRGGSILYRFGNGQTINKKSHNHDRMLYFQHSVQFTNDKKRITLFNNGSSTHGRNYSSLQIYDMENVLKNIKRENRFFNKPHLVWEYKLPGIYSPLLSSIQELDNGNILALDGMHGILYEVSKDKEIVWKFELNPLSLVKPNKWKIQPNSAFYAKEYRSRNIKPKKKSYPLK